jgi:hypothetical protein
MFSMIRSFTSSMYHCSRMYKNPFVPHALTLMNKMKDDIKGMGMDTLILEMCNSEM